MLSMHAEHARGRYIQQHDVANTVSMTSIEGSLLSLLSNYFDLLFLVPTEPLSILMHDNMVRMDSDSVIVIVRTMMWIMIVWTFVYYRSDQFSGPNATDNAGYNGPIEIMTMASVCLCNRDSRLADSCVVRMTVAIL